MDSFLKDKLGKVVTSYGAKVMDIVKTGQRGKSLFKFFGDLKIFKLFLREVTTPSAPMAGKGGVIYVKDDGKPYFSSSTTPEVDLSLDTGASALNDLTDVDTSGVSTGDLIKYNGASWEDFTPPYLEGATTPNTGDVAFFDANGDVITNTSGAFKFDLASSSLVIGSIKCLVIRTTSGTAWVVSNASGDITRIGQSASAEGNVLTWVSGKAIWQVPIDTLDDLTDVDTTTAVPSNGQVLAWDGSNWVPTTGSSSTAITSNIMPVGTGTDIADSDITTEDVSGNVHLASTGASGAFHFHSKDVDSAGTGTRPLILRSGMTPGVDSQEDSLPPTDTLDRASGLVHLRSGNVANNGNGNSSSGEVLVNAGTASSTGGTSTQGKVKIGNETKEVEIGSATATHTTKIKSDLTEVGKSTHTTGNFLKWDGSKAVWDSVGSSGATDLDGLSDVTITSVADNQILKYDLATTQWVNEAEAGGVGGSDTEVQYNNGGTLAGTDLIKIQANNDIILGGAAGTNANVKMFSGSDIIIEADNGGGSGGSSIQYLDSSGGNKVMLAVHNSNKVTLCNRASNGTVEVRANDSNAGSSGEKVVATFHYDGVEVTSNTVAPNNTGDKIYNLDGELHFDRDAIPRTKTITLTPSQYQNLGSTAISLIPAQGTGKHVVVSNVFIKAVNGSTAESRIETLRVGHVSFSTTHYCGMYKQFLRAMPTSSTWVRQIENNSGKLSDTDTANRPVMLYSTGGFLGDVTLDVVITYSVIKL
tara:strand:- start:960 stop:3230 length:2271 start_codon:yes stop_codon:yes gene_type:complete